MRNNEMNIRGNIIKPEGVKTVTFPTITFKGNRFIVFGDRDDGFSMTTPEWLAKLYPSYAYVTPPFGIIMQKGVPIGNIFDLNEPIDLTVVLDFDKGTATWEDSTFTFMSNHFLSQEELDTFAKLSRKAANSELICPEGEYRVQ